LGLGSAAILESRFSLEEKRTDSFLVYNVSNHHINYMWNLFIDPNWTS
jgi:hypothetical protein